MTELHAADTVENETTDANNQSQSGARLSTADLVSAGSQPEDTNTVAEQRPRGGDSTAEDVPLFQAEAEDGFRARWTEIQAAFVDDPRRAVEDADGLVAETMKQLAQMFADERANLERQWQQGDDISTEDLRQALQRYRSFFDRLLSV